MDIRKLLLVSLLALSVTSCQEPPQSEATLESAQSAYDAGQFETALIQLKNFLQLHPEDANGRVLLGKLFLKLNNPVEAERNIRKAIELGVNQNDVILALGQSLLKQRRFQPILEQVQFTGDLTKVSPEDNAELMALQGQAYLGLGDKENAGQYFLQSLALVPNQPRAVLGNAGLAMLRGETDKARQEIQALLKSQPSYEAWLLLGDLERLASRLPDADEAYTQAIKVSTAGSYEQNLTYLYRALVRAFQDHFEEAKADLDRAKSAASGPNAYADYVSGLIEFKQKDYKSAQISFQSVLELMPDYTLAQYFLGATHFLEGQAEQAREHLLKFHDKFPDHKEANKMLAVIDLNLQNDEMAGERLKALIERDPSDTDALNLMAQYYIQTGDLQRGLEMFKKTLTVNPEQANVQLRRGIAAMAIGDLVQADQAFSEAMVNSKNKRQAEFFKFISNIREKNYAEALSLAKQYQTDYPQESLGFNLEALVAKAEGKSEHAKSIFNKVLEQFPGDPSATANLVDSAVDQGQFAEAEALLKASIDKHPKFIRNYLKLAKLYFKQNRDEEGIVQLKAAKEKDPTQLQAVLALAEYYLLHQQPNMALTILQEAQISQNRVPSYLFTLGKAHLASDQVARASEVLNQMITLTPAQENPLVWELQGLIATKEKNWPLAKINYEKLYHQKKTSRWLVNYAEATWQTGDQKGALFHLKKWTDSNPEDRVTRSIFANYLHKSGDLEAAKVEYQALLKDMPNDPMTLNNLAWILKDTDAKAAIGLAEKAVALRPDDINLQDTLNQIKS
ncbi:MAG: XrtA/PEP-CTERM system TPR-repeat protein PrsT [Gammaproteobacteria bacterium]